MTRAEFLKSLGLSSATLMAVYCMGGLTACSSEEPDPNNTTNPGGKVDFTLNLDDAANSKLKTNGEFMYKDKVIVARTNGGDFVALSKACTHEGTTVNFEAANNRFHCPNHGSNFSTNGSVINGPAGSPLKQYKTTLDSIANTLRVFEE